MEARSETAEAGAARAAQGGGWSEGSRGGGGAPGGEAREAGVAARPGAAAAAGGARGRCSVAAVVLSLNMHGRVTSVKLARALRLADDLGATVVLLGETWAVQSKAGFALPPHSPAWQVAATGGRGEGLYSSVRAPGGGVAVLVKAGEWADVRVVPLLDAAGGEVADVAACTARHCKSNSRVLLAAAYWLNEDARSMVPGMDALRKAAQARGRGALVREVGVRVASGSVQGAILGLDANRVVASGSTRGAQRSAPGAVQCSHGHELTDLADALGALLTPGITAPHTPTSFTTRGGVRRDGHPIDYILISAPLAGEEGEHIVRDRVVGEHEGGGVMEGHTDHRGVLLAVRLPVGTPPQPLWGEAERARARAHPATGGLTLSTSPEHYQRDMGWLEAALRAGDFMPRIALSHRFPTLVVDPYTRAPEQLERREREELLGGAAATGDLAAARERAWSDYAGENMEALARWAESASTLEDQEARFRAALLWHALTRLGMRPLAKLEPAAHAPGEGRGQESRWGHRLTCRRRACAETGRATAKAEAAQGEALGRHVRDPELERRRREAEAREDEVQAQCALSRHALGSGRLAALKLGAAMKLVRHVLEGVHKGQGGKRGLPQGMLEADGVTPTATAARQEDRTREYLQRLYGHGGTAAQQQRDVEEVRGYLQEARAEHTAWMAGGGRRTVVSRLCNTPLTTEELEEALAMLKAAAVGGPDNLTAHHLGHAPASWRVAYQRLMVRCWEAGHVPLGWTYCHTAMLYKGKGLLELLYSSYRLLIPQNTCGKWYYYTLAERLKAVMRARRQPPKNFFGWWEGTGTMAAALTFTELIRGALRRGQEVYACLLDLAQAFDRMSHVETAKALRELGVGGALFEAVMGAMTGRRLRTSEGVHQPLSYAGVEAGAGQGCVLSTLLLMILLQTCTRELEGAHAAGMDALLVGQGDSAEGAPLVAVADDMNLLSKTIKGLQRMLDVLSAQLQRAGWQLNGKKCVVMHFAPEGAQRPLPPPVRLGGELLPVVVAAEGFREPEPDSREEEEEEDGAVAREAAAREARGRGNSSSRRGRAAQLPPEGGKTGTILGIKLTSDSRVVGSAHANHRLGVARLAIGRLMSAGLNGLHHEPQAISTLIHAYVHPAAAYGGELLLGAERHTLDTAWEGALGAAMGRDVGSGPRRLPPSYARWLLEGTPLATPTSAIVKAAQLRLWARAITGEFGTSLLQQAMIDSWIAAWARFMPPGPSGGMPTITAARAMQAATVGEEVLRNMLKSSEHRVLVCERPWLNEDLVAVVEEAGEREREAQQRAAVRRWEEAFGSAELYRDRSVSRKGWARLYALQAQPALLLAVGRDSAEGGQRCAGCKAAAPQGQEGSWARAHALLHCTTGEGLVEARSRVLAAAAERARGWAVTGEAEQVIALLGGEVELVRGGRGRLLPELTAAMLGTLAGAAW